MMMTMTKTLTSLQRLGSALFSNTGVKARTKERSFSWTYRRNNRGINIKPELLTENIVNWDDQQR